MPDNSYIPVTGSARQLSYAASDLGIPAATVLPASGSVAGTLINPLGAKLLSVSGTSSVAGTLQVQTFADAAGTVLVATKTTAIPAGTNVVALVNELNDGAFLTFKVTILNTTAGAGTCAANGAEAQA
jgi:hypothetical protein